MSNNTLSEAQFFSLISTITSQHACQILNIDVNKKIINITGPSGSEAACAIQLEKILGEYLID